MDISINNQTLIIIIFFLAINLSAFVVILWDKIKSRKNNGNRISEGMMFFMASIFGSLGVYAGMFACRHKTRKWYFLIGIPMLIIQNCTLVYLIYVLINSV